MALTEVIPSSFTATAKGEAWLNSHPDFIGVVTQFCQTEVKAETCFSDLYAHVGMGDKSLAMQVDDIVVKVSTPTTGRETQRYRFTKPEDLVGQFRFMSALARRLGSGGDVSVPEQYFALNTPFGNLRGEQYMADWTQLGRWFINHYNGDPRQSTARATAVNKTVNTRINRALGLSPLSLGLDFGKKAYQANVLIPVDASDPETSPVCLIDQPSRDNMFGAIAVAVLSRSEK